MGSKEAGAAVGGTKYMFSIVGSLIDLARDLMTLWTRCHVAINFVRGK